MASTELFELFSYQAQPRVWVVGLSARYLQEPAGADDCADISAFLRHTPPKEPAPLLFPAKQPTTAVKRMDGVLAWAGVEGGGGGRMGEGLLRRDASSALVTRQLCNSAEAEVGEAVRSPLFTHQPHPLPNTQTLRAPRQMRTFSGELLVLYVASAEQAVRSWGCQSEKNREDSLLSPRGLSSPRAASCSKGLPPKMLSAPVRSFSARMVSAPAFSWSILMFCSAGL